MAMPPFYDYFYPTLEFLTDGQAHPWKEISNYISELWGLSEEDMEDMIPSGKKTRFEDRAQWARTYLFQAGLLKRESRGVYRISERGHDYFKRAPRQITPNELMEFEEFKNFLTRNRTGGETTKIYKKNTVDNLYNEISTPEEVINEAFQEYNIVLADELLEQVKIITPLAFEHLILQLMLRLGYGGAGDVSGVHLGHSSDGGVDGLIKQDKLGLESIYLQAKRWKNGTVGRPDVQSFVGALNGFVATKGVFITTTEFATDAMEYANKLTSYKITLINGLSLARMMMECDLGVTLVKRYDVKRLDLDFFQPE